MFKINDNYQKLPGSYLFSTIAKKVNAYSAANPEKQIIRLGIGDVTQPIAPAIIEAMHKAVDEMGHAETFHGYAPDLGYDFLRNAIVANDYKARGCDISADEVFVSDGAKSDSGNIQEIFAQDNKIAVCDPVYPVYVDSNVMAGRTGTYDADTQMWSDVIYMPCTSDNNFVPELPKETPDVIYLCLPNNPTGTYINGAKIEKFIRKVHEKAARLHPDDDQDVVVIVDEAYYEYVDDPTHYSMIEMVQKGYDRPLIVQRTFSKAYGLAGLRIGYAITQPALADAIMKACQAWNYSGPGLLACEAALDYQDYIKKVKALNIENRNYVADELKQLGFEVVPPAANFIFFGIPEDATAEEREKMDPVRVKNELAERKILIGAPNGHNRVSIGTAEECKMFIAAMKEIVR